MDWSYPLIPPEEQEAVLTEDLATAPQEQKDDLGPVACGEPRHQFHNHFNQFSRGRCYTSSSQSFWSVIEKKKDAPPTPPPELWAVWDSQAHLVLERQRHADRLREDVRRKGLDLAPVLRS